MLELPIQSTDLDIDFSTGMQSVEQLLEFIQLQGAERLQAARQTAQFLWLLFMIRVASRQVALRERLASGVLPLHQAGRAGAGLQ